MGTRSSTPDLFSTPSAREPSSPSVNSPSSSAITHTSSRHVLPANLPNAVKKLGDQELDRLLEAVIAEQRRRGRKLPASDETSRKRKREVKNAPLTQGEFKSVRCCV